ncbi:hypothetical protein WMV32_00240 [Brevundimonas diminuta]
MAAADRRPGYAPDASIVGNRVLKAGRAKLKAGLMTAPMAHAQGHDPVGSAGHGVSLDKPTFEFCEAGSPCCLKRRICQGGHPGDKGWRREVVDIARQNLKAFSPDSVAERERLEPHAGGAPEKPGRQKLVRARS